MIQKPILCILVPCYNEEDGINDSIKILDNLINEIIQEDLISIHSFLLFIDDGSTDSTYLILQKNKLQNHRILKLANNKGQQFALLAALITQKIK
ncbi:MAG: glycosyltransferase [Agriterribacter sp.]